MNPKLNGGATEMVSFLPMSTKALFSTTRIVGKTKSGGTKIGTAFFFDFHFDDDHVSRALVTNSHVVEGCMDGQFLLHEGLRDQKGLQAPGPKSFTISVKGMFEPLWVKHPTGLDLCAMPIGFLHEQAKAKSKEIFCVSFDRSVVPSQGTLGQLAALERVVMPGYPIGLWDETNNLPLLRLGTTSSHPALDHNGKPEGVLDIAAFPGSSGSPILILDEGTYATPSGLVVGSRALLLGILSSGPQYVEGGKIAVSVIPTGDGQPAQGGIPIHMGYYIKARELETLGSAIFKRYGPPKSGSISGASGA